MFSEVVYCSRVGTEYRVGMAVDQALATSDLSVRDAESEIRELTAAAARTAENVEVPTRARAIAVAV